MSPSAFFIVSKTINWLAYPLSLVLVALAVVVIGWRRRWARPLLALTVLALVGQSLPVTGDAVIGWWEGSRPAAERLHGTYDAVVVLSGMVDLEASREGRVELGGGADRIVEGVALVRQGVAEHLVISGGSGLLFDQTVSEAEMLAGLAKAWGVPAQRIVVEGRSRNTRENAVETAALARAHGWRRLVLVTSAFHMPRASACFRKAGLEPDCWPVDFRSSHRVTPLGFIPSVDGLQAVTIVVNEIVGMVVYRLQGYI